MKELTTTAKKLEETTDYDRKKRTKLQLVYAEAKMENVIKKCLQTFGSETWELELELYRIVKVSNE
jgi:hypothetical protein